ncbi:homoserine dehydrogenase [Candidatus Viridilinea mediisalina]|uniref:Homoserine dehydrogenase n=1 Tax=Candidatus Viridilinea mediisalina TaxID=2024553 RepID=A0A2A6RND4_9CHLR|nr:homoserine dehydrogenase [Candidatus Viridilinea mediisalina]PDW04411.1 homoserine dehydrogenase [Candidatus Viridilinea mediisalina]
MQTIPLIQIGLGGVGRELVRQVLATEASVARRYGLRLAYMALADSGGVLASGSMLSRSTLDAALAAKEAGHSVAAMTGPGKAMRWGALALRQRAIFVDLTAADGHEVPLAARVATGDRVVLANKRPLSAELASFRSLTANGMTRYESTVGAGLPVISTLQNLLDSGDTIVRIEAAMSGTLGYLCSELEAGKPLSVALRKAHALGYTEPDPRDDLSGADVARKALILARSCGLAWEPDAVVAQPWFPPALAQVSRDEFLARAEELDAPFAERVAEARASGGALRYVASLGSSGASVSLRILPPEHPLAGLRGPDNFFSFTTARYSEYPLIVRGPGAGVAVTAAGVLSDLIATARELEC